MNTSKIALFAFLSFLLFTQKRTMHAQGMDWNGPQNQGVWKKHINALTPENAQGQIVIELTGLQPSITAQWLICAQSGAGICSEADLTIATTEATSLADGKITAYLANNNTQLIVKGIVVPLNDERITLVVRVRDRDNINNFKYRQYNIVLRKPMQIVFALDRSGSMECPEGNALDWPNCSGAVGTGSRWHKLKEAMVCFLTKINAFDSSAFILPSDRFKLLYFSGTASTLDVWPTGNTTGMNFNVSNPIDVQNNMIAHQNLSPLARDGTSFGLAVRDAMTNHFTSVDPANPETTTFRKVLVLMTDGEQNRDPSVVGTGRQLTETIPPNAPAITFNMDAANYRDIQTFTIGVGVAAGSSINNMLSQMINSTVPGTYHSTINTNMNNLMSEFNNNLYNSIFSTSSPQLIGFENKILSIANTSTFLVNKNVSHLFFETIFDQPAAPDFSFKIERDGIDMTAKARLSRGKFYGMLSLDIQGLGNEKSEGKWQLTVFSPTGGSPYLGTQVRLSATADEHTLKFKCNAGKDYFQACDAIQPSVQLLEAGVSITNATVTATIYEPGADIGDLLARTPAQSIPPASTSLDAGSCALQKYNALKLSNPALIQSYENYQPTTINLTHAGNGLYTAKGYKTNVTGVYKIVYKAEATTTKLGMIQRTEEQTINVRFPQLTYKIENRKVNKPRGSDGFYFYALSIKPSFKDCAGKDRFVGPGWEKDFKISGRQISNVTVADQCDSGEYIISVTSRNKSPYIKVDLLDEPIYSGFINDFNKPFNPHKWHIGLGIGATIPKNRLDTLYNSSWFVKLSVDRRISHSFSVGAAAGHWRFDKNFYINGATIGASGYGYIPNWIDNGLPIDISVGVGVGAFKPKNQDLEGGGTAHASIAYDLTPRISLFIEGSYYKLLTSKYDFGTLGGGVRVKF